MKCRDCGHVFDALQKMSDDPLRDCPDCGRPELRKLLSAPNFRLKGGGWYETDFKDKNKRNLHGDDGAASGSSAEKSSSDKPSSDKPSADKPSSDKPASDKPKAKPVDKSG